LAGGRGALRRRHGQAAGEDRAGGQLLRMRLAGVSRGEIRRRHTALHPRHRRRQVREAIMLLENRIALVTGAASGLGLATATAFAREGATVVINDLRLEAAQEAAARLGDKHFAVAGDVSSEE